MQYKQTQDFLLQFQAGVLGMLLAYNFFEVRHPRCVGSMTKNFGVLHIQSNTTAFHPVVQ